MNGVKSLKLGKRISKAEKETENAGEDEEGEDDSALAQPSTSKSASIDEHHFNSLAHPSTSRTGILDEPRWNTSTRQIYEDNLKSDSILKLDIALQDDSRDCESSLTDSASSDESCVYMYKGGSVKSSSLNMLVNCSSPEMDFLEMDFDPCQSNGHESSDGSYSCEVDDLRDEENIRTLPSPSVSDQHVTPTNEDFCCSSPNENLELGADSKSNSTLLDVSKINISEIPSMNVEQNPQCSNSLDYNHHTVKRPKEEFTDDLDENITESLANCILRLHLCNGSNNLSCCLTTLNEALCLLCGLGSEIKDEHKLQELLLPRELEVPTTLPFTEFLKKMSLGMLTVPEIQDAIEQIFDGSIASTFFSPYPSSVMNLSSWLQNWIKKGAVALLCWNFHLTGEECNLIVNPSWHFHLVNKCSSTGIQVYPQEDLIHENLLKKLLNNPSEVLIDKEVVMAHWNPRSSLKPLLYYPDHSWKQYNVLGQVVNIIRDTVNGQAGDDIGFVRLPSSHKAGILIFMRSDNAHLDDLKWLELVLKLDVHK